MAKLLKVTLEFDDKILSLEGDNVEEWNNWLESVVIHATMHGMNSKPLEWKVKEKLKCMRCKRLAPDSMQKMSFSGWMCQECNKELQTY